VLAAKALLPIARLGAGEAAAAQTLNYEFRFFVRPAPSIMPHFACWPLAIHLFLLVFVLIKEPQTFRHKNDKIPLRVEAILA
jgi:hypothetical protein